jgi:hypothetical protein
MGRDGSKGLFAGESDELMPSQGQETEMKYALGHEI